MKILFLSDDFPPQSFGGAGIVAFNLARAISHLGHTVTIITTVQDKTAVGVVQYEGLTVHRIYSKCHARWRAYCSLYNPQTLRSVKNILTQLKPDVVHAHNIHQHLSYHCLKLAKKSGAKVFLTAHDVMLFHYGKLVECLNPNDVSIPQTCNYKISAWQQIKTYKKRYNPLRNSIIKHYLKNVDRIFAVSNALKETLNQNGIYNVEVMHNGINVDEWKTDRASLDIFIQKHSLQGKKVILFGGRLSDAKGGYQAVRAMKEVAATVPNAVMLIMGGINTYVEHTIHIAQELGVDKHLIFTGWISGQELKSAYASADVVLVPSLYLDPFPTINLEAMACKKPVVGTCFGGTPELVEHGVTGYVVNPYDIQSLSKYIVSVLMDDTRALAMGKNAYDRVEKYFPLAKQVQNSLSAYGNNDT